MQKEKIQTTNINADAPIGYEATPQPVTRSEFEVTLEQIGPTMSELADIEMQVLSDPDMTGLEPDDTLPPPVIVRDYTPGFGPAHPAKATCIRCSA